MDYVTARQQRGMSLLGMFLMVGIVAVLVVLGARVVPTVIEYRAIETAVEKARKGESPEEVRRIFDRAAEVEGIKSISGKDLQITKDSAGRLAVAYAYDRLFALGGPAYLLIKYSGPSL